MSNGLRDHPTVQIVFQWTLPRQTPEADARVESTQVLFPGKVMPWGKQENCAGQASLVNCQTEQ